MKRFVNCLVEFLLYIWQLPQNIVGLCVMLYMMPFLKKEKKYRGDVNVYVSAKMAGGVSLGKYIFLDRTYGNFERYGAEVWNHEYGHTRQSRILGPLYLLVIGLPSIIWAGLYGSVIPYTHNGYYKFYPEKWANKLGGVVLK